MRFGPHPMPLPRLWRKSLIISKKNKIKIENKGKAVAVAVVATATGKEP